MKPSARCARKNDLASPSATGARGAEVRTVDKVASGIRAEPTSVQPPADVSDCLLKKKPSASKINDSEVSAMVKWTKIGCMGAPNLTKLIACLRLVTVPPRSVGLFITRPSPPRQ